jgi:arylformamidase
MKTRSSTIIGPAKVIKIDQQKFEITTDTLKRFSIEKDERILLRTANSNIDAERMHTLVKRVHLTADAISYLIAKEVSCVGIDYLLADCKDAHDINCLFAETAINVIQGLQLGSIEPGEYDMICLPLPATIAAVAHSRVILKPSKQFAMQYA